MRVWVIILCFCVISHRCAFLFPGILTLLGVKSLLLYNQIKQEKITAVKIPALVVVGTAEQIEAVARKYQLPLRSIGNLRQLASDNSRQNSNQFEVRTPFRPTGDPNVDNLNRMLRHPLILRLISENAELVVAFLRQLAGPGYLPETVLEPEEEGPYIEKNLKTLLQIARAQPQLVRALTGSNPKFIDNLVDKIINPKVRQKVKNATEPEDDPFSEDYEDAEDEEKMNTKTEKPTENENM